MVTRNVFSLVFLFFHLIHLPFITRACPQSCTCRSMENAQTVIVNCSERIVNPTSLYSNFPSANRVIATFGYNPEIIKLKPVPAMNVALLAISYDHCNITDLELGLFENITKLEHLDLSWNRLDGRALKPEVFRGRFNTKYDAVVYGKIALVDLNLSNNLIRNLHHRTFVYTPKLKRLNLGNNPLHRLDPATSLAISTLRDLQELNLSGTSLQDVPEKLTTSLRFLSRLDVSYNEFMDVPRSFAYLTSLKTLKMRGTPIEHLDQYSFVGLESLKELDISDSHVLITIKENTFNGLPNLQVLNSSNNTRLHEINENAFGVKKTNLEELYVKNAALKTISPNLFNWTTLQVVDFSDNDWECNCTIYEIMHKLMQTSRARMHTSRVAVCSPPPELTGIALHELTLEMCHRELRRVELYPRENNYIKYLLFTVLLFLCLIIAYIFWLVLLKYKAVRAVHVPYSVVYINDPGYS